MCGYNEGFRDVTSMPNLYLFQPTNYSSYRMCVSTCPSVTGNYICQYDMGVPTNKTTFLPYLKAGNCTLTIATTPGKSNSGIFSLYHSIE